jgi:recombination protein U
MKSGKRFENNFKKSVPSNIFFYRFKDGSSAWGGNDKVRFQSSNICDCELFDGNRLYLLELKSIKGKSIPFSNIRENQLKELSEAQKFKNIIAGIVIEFNELDRAFFMHIDNVIEFMLNGGRKSIPLAYCKEKGIEIEVEKKRVNNSFNIKRLLDEI